MKDGFILHLDRLKEPLVGRIYQSWLLGLSMKIIALLQRKRLVRSLISSMQAIQESETTEGKIESPLQIIQAIWSEDHETAQRKNRETTSREPRALKADDTLSTGHGGTCCIKHIS